MFEWDKVNPLCQSRLSYPHFPYREFVSRTDKYGLLWGIDAYAHPCLTVKTRSDADLQDTTKTRVRVWHVTLTPCRSAPLEQRARLSPVGRSWACPPSEQRPGEGLHLCVPWARYPGAGLLRQGKVWSLSLKSSWGGANAPLATSAEMLLSRGAWDSGSQIPQARLKEATLKSFWF